jgi:membrane dipeptidase
VGVEHIGLGSDTDLDGRDHGNPARARFDIQGLNHPLRIYDLTQGLINRRYSDRSIELILGENFKRALGDIWQKSITPVTSPLNS